MDKKTMDKKTMDKKTMEKEKQKNKRMNGIQKSDDFGDGEKNHHFSPFL